MKLMQVKDVSEVRQQLLLTGPLLVQGMQRRSEVQAAFGRRVEIQAPDGSTLLVTVKDVAVSQTLAGAYLVCMAVDLSGQGPVAIDSIVHAAG